MNDQILPRFQELHPYLPILPPGVMQRRMSPSITHPEKLWTYSNDVMNEIPTGLHTGPQGQGRHIPSQTDIKEICVLDVILI